MSRSQQLRTARKRRKARNDRNRIVKTAHREQKHAVKALRRLREADRLLRQ